VRTHDEILASEQARVNGTFLESAMADGTPVALVRSPYVIQPSSPAVVAPPPVLGADTRAVAREVGFSEDEVAELIASGALGADDPRP
jgi:crotonobetainyl-CoA:carnitine CoA-transferase CaiB-like acyl-CoA transferase